MKGQLIHRTIWLISMLCLSASLGQAQTEGSKNEPGNRSVTNAGESGFFDLLARRRPARRQTFSFMSSERNASKRAPEFSFAPMAAGANQPVFGIGDVGRLTKWTAFTNGQSFIGNSTIFENNNGMVGIGTDSPTSKLTVVGLIETVNPGGGIKFPDGTIQTTAGVGSIFHDASLMGNGSQSMPVGVSVPLSLSGSSGGPILSVSNSNTIGILGQGNGAASGVVGLNGPGPWPACGNSGVCGSSSSKSGVVGASLDSFGVFGLSSNSSGVAGISLNGGLAGEFAGNVNISGTLSAAAKNFKIDHPLDPENKYLNHVSVESPDMKNIYDGNVTTNENGEAIVELPAYFEALNRDFRYQLTVIGTFAQAIVADEIKGNRFTIRTNAPNVKVSWQVTGIRQDQWAKKNRIQVEVEKSERERGWYLHPEAFDQPEERGIEWSRNPEMMRQLKQQLIQQKHKANNQ